VGYIVGGPYEGKKMVGCSMVVDKSGVIRQGVFNEFAGDLIVADIELKIRAYKGTEIGSDLINRGFKTDELLRD
jgi:hypothetical protein